VGLDRGVRVHIGLEAIGEPNEDGVRSVVFRLNGQLRPIDVLDRSVATVIVEAEKADPARPEHVAAPFRGVVNVSVEAGSSVSAGDSVAVIEAMKMESHITAPFSGTVVRVAMGAAASVEPGDLIMVLRPSGTPDSPVIYADESF